MCDDIEVFFTLWDGLLRRSVVQKCVPMLELETSNESYQALLEELTHIVKEHQAWSFDMI